MAHEFSVKSDVKWMSEAVALAEAALRHGEFPVGAVLVAENEIVGRGARLHSRQGAANELDHAEILAIRDMSCGDYLSNTSFDTREITAYVTLEPCLMCLGALLINGVRRIVFAYEDVMGGACGICERLTASSWSHSGNELDAETRLTKNGLYGGWSAVGGLMRRESLALFKAFFRSSSSDYLRNTLLERYTLEAR
ncbi:MAG: nucleoside deaminase [Dissulfuribacterales bacterium]